MNKIIFQCAICEKLFKDETDLNAHTLFIHGIQRGFCHNPNSKFHLDEVGRILNDLIITYTPKRKGGITPNHLKQNDILLIKRIIELGYEFPYFLKSYESEYKDYLNVYPFTKGSTQYSDKTIKYLEDIRDKEQEEIKKIEEWRLEK